MADPPGSLQKIIQQRQQAGFIGREAQLAFFRDNLARPPDDERRRFLFAIHGDGGIGKTFLVARLVKAANERGWLTAVTDDAAYDVLEVMAAIAGQLSRLGGRLKRFEQKYAAYRRRASERGIEVSVGEDAASLVTQTAVRVGLGAARSLPLGGVVTEFVDPKAAAEGTDQLRAAAMKKMRSRDGKRLLHSPVEELTAAFVDGLRQTDTPVAVFFDAYERTSVFLDDWLRGLFDGTYGPLPADLVITVAGRSPLDASRWSAYLGIVADIPLVPFSDVEVRQMLAHEGVTNESAVNLILRVSGGLPLAVAMLAQASPSSDQAPVDVTASIVERFLQWEENPARREIALVAALPRRFDRDVIDVLTSASDTAEMYEWLAQQPFVTSIKGKCHYHEVVRGWMISLNRGRSPQQWREMHERLAEATQRWRERLGHDSNDCWDDPAWADYLAEESYHRLCADSAGAVPDALARAVDACLQTTTLARKWADLLTQAGHDADAADVLALGTSLQEALSAADGGEIRFLDAILRERPLSSEVRANAYRVRGRQHRVEERYEQAISDFGRAIALSPQYEDAFAGRGETYRLMRRFNEALADLSRAIELDPEDSWAAASRSQAYQSLGRYDEALADLTRAIEISPQTAFYLAGRGHAYRLMEHYDEAVADFTRAIELDSEPDLYLAWRGHAYRLMERYDEAVADFTRAIELDPEYAWAAASRGDAYQSLGRYDEALADLTRAIELDSEPDLYLAWRGETFRLMERYDEAVADFTRAIELDPEYAWAAASRGQAYRELGRYDEALADLTRAIELDPGRAWMYAERGRTNRTVGRQAEANADLDSAVALDPEDEDYAMERAMVRGVEHIGENGFQCIVDLDATASDCALHAETITKWQVSKGIIEPERTICGPGQRSGYAPGPFWRMAVSADSSCDDESEAIRSVQVDIGRGFYHPLALDAVTCPICRTRIQVRRERQLTTAWECVIDAATLWQTGGNGILRCPDCSGCAHLREWQFEPTWAFGHLCLVFWNWPPLTETFIAEVSRQLGHRVAIIVGRR